MKALEPNIIKKTIIIHSIDHESILHRVKRGFNKKYLKERLMVIILVISIKNFYYLIPYHLIIGPCLKKTVIHLSNLIARNRYLYAIAKIVLKKNDSS